MALMRSISWKICIGVACAVGARGARAEQGCIPYLLGEASMARLIAPSESFAGLPADLNSWLFRAGLLLDTQYALKNESAVRVLLQNSPRALKMHASYPMRYPLNRLVDWAHEYGQCLEPLLKKFSFEFAELEELRRDVWGDLCSAVEEFPLVLGDLSALDLRDSSRELARVARSFDGAGVGLLHSLGERVLELEARHHDTLALIARAAGKNTSSVFYNLIPKFLDSHPTELVQVVEQSRERAGFVLRSLTEGFFLEHLSTILRASLALGLKNWPSIPVEHLAQLVDPAIERGLRNAAPRFKAVGVDLQTVLQHLAPAYVLKHADSLERLCALGDRHSHSSLLHNADTYCRIGGQDLEYAVRLLEKARDSDGLLIRQIHSYKLARHADLILELADLVPLRDLGALVNSLPTDLATRDPKWIRALVGRRPASARGIFLRFKENARSLEFIHLLQIDRIEQLTQRGASDFIEAVPESLWEDPEVLEAAEFYGENAGRIFRAVGGKARWLELSKEPLLHFNRTVFGIHAFEVFLKPGRYSLLQMNAANLNPDFLPGRPVAAVFYARDDWNSAVHSKLASRAAKLSEKYRTFVIEIGTKDEVEDHLHRIHLLLGPVDLMVLDAHASGQFMVFGAADPFSDGEQRSGAKPAAWSLTVADARVMRRWQTYLKPGATCLLGGCATADPHTVGNLFERVATSLPGSHIIGALKNIFGWDVELGPTSTRDRFWMQGSGAISVSHDRPGTQKKQ